MKISELRPLDTTLTPDKSAVILPAVVNGSNQSVSLQYIVDNAKAAVDSSLGKNIEFFAGIMPGEIIIDDVDSYYIDGHVVYSPTHKKFLWHEQTTSLFHSTWPNHTKFLTSSGAIRQDVLFIDRNKGIYGFNGTDLIALAVSRSDFDTRLQTLRDSEISEDIDTKISASKAECDSSLDETKRLLEAKIAKLTPIRIESEEAYDEMILNGTIDPEQIYYIAE